MARAFVRQEGDVANVIRLDDREVRQALQRLAREGSPRIVKTALEKTAFEIKAAEQTEIAGAFRFASPNTQRFLSTSVRFTPVRLGQTETTIGPLEASSNILIQHEKPSTISANNQHLEHGQQLAVPVGVKRGPSGRILKALTPAQLIGKAKRRKRLDLGVFGRQTLKERYFVSRSGKAVLAAIGRQVRVLYALTPSARLKDRLDFAETAERTAKRELPRKVKEAFEKEARRVAARR